MSSKKGSRAVAKKKVSKSERAATSMAEIQDSAKKLGVFVQEIGNTGKMMVGCAESAEGDATAKMEGVVEMLTKLAGRGEKPQVTKKSFGDKSLLAKAGKATKPRAKPGPSEALTGPKEAKAQCELAQKYFLGLGGVDKDEDLRLTI